ncbi:MAG: hypothetical protein LBO72_10205 [Helicobacteraceae bacterium]|jgi:type III restriction enzyme|nr:hypothetical protein [Helicobacteraceae bacterium]
MKLNPDIVGSSITTNKSIIGEPIDLKPTNNESIRLNSIAFHLTKRLLEKMRGESDPPFHLFGQIIPIAKEWLENYLICEGDVFKAQILYDALADTACERILSAIDRARAKNAFIKPTFDPYNKTGSTAHVSFHTVKQTLYRTEKSHINYAVLDSDWEGEFCRTLDASPMVSCYVKNHGLDFEIPYQFGGRKHIYRPDYIVKVGQDKSLNLIIEIKGQKDEQDKAKAEATQTMWIPSINACGSFGKWAFAEFTEVFNFAGDLENLIKENLQ